MGRRTFFEKLDICRGNQMKPKKETYEFDVCIGYNIITMNKDH